MSDDEEYIEEKPFAIEIAKQGRAVCKKCKQKCLQGELRIAKLVPNPFGSGKMKAWHHVDCLFELFLKQRQSTKRIDGPDEIDGWDSLNDDEKNTILEKIKESDAAFHAKFGTKPKKSPKKQSSPKARSPRAKSPRAKSPRAKSPRAKSPRTNSPRAKSPKAEKIETTNLESKDEVLSVTSSSSSGSEKSKDHLFKEFRRLVADITNNPGYLDKTKCVQKLFKEGTDGSGFKDDVVLWCRLLLPGVIKRVYNLQSKQLIKLFSRLFLTDQNDMLEHLERGDIGETIQKFFEQSLKVKPARKSSLTVKEVDNFLVNLSKLTREDDQMDHFKKIIPKCTSNDLKSIIRLIKGDLRMGAGAKHILEGIHPDAYEAYQASRDIQTVIEKCLSKKDKGKKTNKTVKAEISVMTPILPMLAEACKSVEQAMKKCPNGMYSEIKYDGERVQVHKHGSEFKYFSRNLKPVLPHKIQHFKEYIPKAFPHAKDLILDSEILMIDTKTSKPLPFGTLGVHKKAEFQDANVCLFVFDCIFYNGESLINKPITHRKKILQDTMTEIPNHIVFSEMKEISKPKELTEMIAKVLTLGLEGLVLKDFKSTYEPGKRHWLKVKKDYLFGGAMADTADLIVLGAWYGTGKKGGMMSIFLMGCYNSKSKKFCTVTKVHTGHDDKTLEQLQDELDMVKISQDMSKVPSWLNCTKTMVPDFVAKDPKAQPVWEITGAEFTQHDVHTADGISIRFPRVTRIRDDKDWQTATNLLELQKLYKTSKESTDVSMLMKQIGNDDDTSKSDEPPPKKQKKDVTDFEKKDEKKPSTKESKASPIGGIKKRRLSERLNRRQQDVDDELKLENNNESNNVSRKESVDSKTESVEAVSLEIKEPIPDYFKGIKALLEDELKTEEHSETIRYFIAYGGIVLEETQWEDATHVLHYYNILRQPTMKCPRNATHIAIEWVTDTIAKSSLQDPRRYRVKWDPDS